MCPHHHISQKTALHRKILMPPFCAMDEGFDKRYIAFVDHTDQAKRLKRDNPRLAWVNACLARAARNLLFKDVLAGVVQLRTNGTPMRIEHVPPDESRRQFRTRMQQVPAHVADQVAGQDFASAVMEMFTRAGVAIVELPPVPEWTIRLRVIEAPSNV